MKKNVQLKIRLFIIFAIFLFATQRTFTQPANDPGRGMYVNNFLTLDASNNVVNSLSILGVDAQGDGIYEKEDALLNYADKHHITYLALYSLGSLFKNRTVEINGIKLEDHLKRFIRKAKGFEVGNIHHIQKIGGVTGGLESLNNIGDYSNDRIMPGGASPYFTPAQIANQSPEYVSLNTFINNSAVAGLPDEVSIVTRILLQMQALSSLYEEKIDVISIEYEFWTNGNYNTTFKSVVSKMAKIKRLHNTTPGITSLLSTEIYLGQFKDPSISTNNQQAVANYIDGLDSYGEKLFDKIYLDYYSRDPEFNGLTPISDYEDIDKYRLDFLKTGTTENNTLVHPLFSAGNYVNGSFGPYYGSWFEDNSTNNMYLSERDYTDALYRDPSYLYNGTPTSENRILPGGAGWYTSSYMIEPETVPSAASPKSTDTQFLHTNSPVCIPTGSTTANVTFDYVGPIENDIVVNFSLTGGVSTINWSERTANYNVSNYSSLHGNPANLSSPSIPQHIESLQAGTYVLHTEVDYGSGYLTTLENQNIIVNANPVIQVISGPDLCEGKTLILRASVDDAIWKRNGSTISGVAQREYVKKQLTTSDDNKIYTYTSATCTSTVAPLTVNVRSNPVASFTTLPVACGTQLSASAGSSYLWSTGETSQNIVVSQDGSYFVKITQSSGCSNFAKDRITAAPSLHVSINVTTPIACGGGSNGALQAIVTNAAPGNNLTYTWSTSGSPNLGNNLTISGLSEGIYTFVVNDIVNGCSDSKTVTLTQPNSADAGQDQIGASTCNQPTLILAGNEPTVGTGMWTIISGTGGLLENINDPMSNFSGIAGNSYVLRWTITSGICPVSFDDVMLNFNQTPTVANAGADQTNLCGVTSTNLAANLPTVGTGTWSIVSGAGGSFALNNDPSTTFTGTLGTTYVLRWTISNAPCTSSADDVTITFNNNPTAANAGADQTNLCGVTSTNLAANLPTVGTGTWSIVSGTIGGSFTSITDPNTLFTGTSGTIYTLRWTISNPPCQSSYDDVQITFPSNPTANAGADININCLSTVTLGATSPLIGTGKWTVISGTGIFSQDNSPTSLVTGLSVGSNVFRWTVSYGSCTPTNDDVIVNLNSSFPTSQTSTITGTYSLNASFDVPSGNMTISASTINIGKDVTITIKTGRTLTINSSTLKACGSEMWNGIVIEAGGKLVLDQNSTIEDAVTGADFRSGSVSNLRNSNFNRCYTSISMNGNINNLFPFTNIKFTCVDGTGVQTNLLSPFSTLRASGISLINTSIFISGNSQTEFKNLRTAISATNSIISIQMCSFSNIHLSATSSTTKAIDVSNNSVLIINKSVFSDCENAIYAADCSVNLTKNNFTNVLTAISVIHPSIARVDINSNNINCKLSGINLLTMEDAYRAYVLGNTIVVGDVSNPTANNCFGIQYSSSSNAIGSRIGGQISYNTITVLSQGDAIGLNFKKGMVVSNNYISLQNSLSSNDQKGINSLNNQNLAVSCNYVTGDHYLSPGGNQTSMNFVNTLPTYDRVSCNTLRHSNSGVEFLGSFGFVNLKHNIFDNDYRGLYLGLSTDIGSQMHQGNYWSTNYSSSHLAAENASYSFNVSQKVFVNYSSAINYHPTYVTAGWFYDPNDGLPEKDCTFPSSFGDYTIQVNECSAIIPALEDESERTRPNDSIVIKDLLPLSIYQDEISYMAKDELYRRLNEFPELLDSNLYYAEFYDSLQNSNIEEFSRIEHYEVDKDSVAKLLTYNIQNIDSLLNWHLESIAYNDSIGDSVHVSQNTIHFAAIENLSNNMSIYRQLLESSEYLNLLQARNKNEDIVANIQIEENRQVINEIRLACLSNKDFSFNPDIDAAISGIAHQCPLSGGDAVSIARALYAIKHPNEYYDDKSACLSQGYFRSAKPESSYSNITNSLSYFTINPNPASDFINLKYYLANDINVEFNLYNSLMQRIKTCFLPSDVKEYNLNCSDLTNGVYFYSIIINSEVLYKGKISILNRQ